MRYRVEIIMQYTEICYVEANSEAEAEQIGLETEDRERIYDDHAHDTTATEEEGGN